MSEEAHAERGRFYRCWTTAICQHGMEKRTGWETWNVGLTKVRRRTAVIGSLTSLLLARSGAPR